VKPIGRDSAGNLSGALIFQYILTGFKRADSYLPEADRSSNLALLSFQPTPFYPGEAEPDP